MQLNRLQISDLGLARKITVCKNHTVVEGNANYCHLFLPAWSTNGQVLRLEMKTTLGAQLALIAFVLLILCVVVVLKKAS